MSKIRLTKSVCLRYHKGAKAALRKSIATAQKILRGKKLDKGTKAAARMQLTSARKNLRYHMSLKKPCENVR